VAALDALRGLAIVAVCLRHFARGAPLTDTQAWTLAALKMGWLGVDLFFVLSGFLITGVLLDAKGRPGYFRNFYERRTRRILPVYAGTLAVLFWLVPAAGPRWAGWVRDVADAQGWFWAFASNVWLASRDAWPLFHAGEHYWSLAVEEQFYLLWPFAVLALSPRVLARASLGIAIAAFAARAGALVDGVSPIAIYVLLPMRMDGLALGAVLAVWRRDGVPPWACRYARPIAVVAAGTLVVLFASLMDPIYHAATQTIGYTAAAVLFMTCVGATWVNPDGRWALWLGNRRALQQLGVYSYGVYVFHVPIYGALERAGLGAVRWITWTGNVWAGQLAFIAIAGGASVGLAALSWHGLESRLLRPRARSMGASTSSSGSGSVVALRGTPSDQPACPTCSVPCVPDGRAEYERTA